MCDLMPVRLGHGGCDQPISSFQNSHMYIGHSYTQPNTTTDSALWTRSDIESLRLSVGLWFCVSVCLCHRQTSTSGWVSWRLLVVESIAKGAKGANLVFKKISELLSCHAKIFSASNMQDFFIGLIVLKQRGQLPSEIFIY